MMDTGKLYKYSLSNNRLDIHEALLREGSSVLDPNNNEIPELQGTIAVTFGWFILSC